MDHRDLGLPERQHLLDERVSAERIIRVVSHSIFSQNRMLIVCVSRNQVYTHTK
jgi:hypothetical protein